MFCVLLAMWQAIVELFLRLKLSLFTVEIIVHSLLHHVDEEALWTVYNRPPHLCLASPSTGMSIETLHSMESPCEPERRLRTGVFFMTGIAGWNGKEDEHSCEASSPV